MINLNLIHFFQKGFIYFFLTFLSFVNITAQQTKQNIETRYNELIQFSKSRDSSWKLEKFWADSLAKILKMPVSYTDKAEKEIILQRLGYRNKPIYYATDNLNAAATISVNKLWSDENDYPSLNGEEIMVNIWDGGSILSTHQEFQEAGESRILMQDRDILISNHSTHIAGTIGATGINTSARGMAGKASLHGWDMNNDIAEMSMVAADDAIVSNHSYGPLCGWYYNSTTGYWYWYGDITISTIEDYEFGFYNQTSADLDYIAWSAPNYLIVKSAGNDRNDAPPVQPVNHYVWDETWLFVNNALRDSDGGDDGYDCLSPMSVSKNILTVGAVDDAKNMTSFSAYGPTDDGRIKPDVTANGKDVYSSIGSAINAYGSYDGTSMAAASVTGSVALVHNLQEIVQPGVKLISSTIKGLLIHTADEAGSNPGPDFIFGWGILNLKTACDLIYNNAINGGKNIQEDIIAQGETINIPIKTSDNSPFLKITICWTDPPGDASVPSLNPRDSKLTNDINIELENVSNQNKYYPWVMDFENPELPAIQGINHRDNVEQIFLPNPGSGNFNLKISHSGTLTGNSQQYSLLISGNLTSIGIFPPKDLKYLCNESSVRLKWDHPETTLPIRYNVYRNNTLLALAADTFYNDNSVIADILYDYYVKAVYVVNGEEIESLSTNSITVCPRSLRPLPFIENFEEIPTEVMIKNTAEAWRWGDSELLSCYYLDFSENTTNFIGADSYSAGDLAHVMDVAETMPLRLAEYTNISISFDYILNTGIYGAIDELNVVYKLPEEEEWTDWVNLSRALDWTSETFSLPEEAYRNGTRIGFYFDDFYQWGLGAGIDNIVISGTPIRTVDFAISSLNLPASSCSLSENEVVSIEIRNDGEQAAMPGDVIQIQMHVSSGLNVVDQLVLDEPLNNGDIITHQLSSNVDLSNAGTYTFEFVISCTLDHNDLNNTLESSVEVFGFPNTVILNQDLTFCNLNQQILLDVNPIGGTLSGDGIVASFFNPSIAGDGNHIITYTYSDENGCESSTEKIFEVLPLPQPVMLNQDLIFCINDAEVLIEVEPAGGMLSGPGISGLYFYPSVAEAGTHLITYSYEDINGCEGSTSIELIVSPLPDPKILNKDLTFCINDAEVLIEVEPSGGLLSGPGISGLYFYPSVVGAGTHLITYSYEDINGCEGSASIELIVSPLPDPKILNQDLTFCINDAEVLIEVEPSGGILEGPGISNQFFYPILAGTGTHYISYKYIDINGCSSFVEKKVEVFENPIVNLGRDQNININNTIELIPSGNGTSFKWYDGSTDNKLTIIAQNLGLGTHDIWVMAYSNQQCSAVDSIQLNIDMSELILPASKHFRPMVVPNPFKYGFYLVIEKQEKVKNLILYGANGRVFLNYSSKTMIPYYDVSYLPSGVYFLKVETERQKVILKILKM